MRRPPPAGLLGIARALLLQNNTHSGGGTTATSSKSVLAVLLPSGPPRAAVWADSLGWAHARLAQASARRQFGTEASAGSGGGQEPPAGDGKRGALQAASSAGQGTAVTVAKKVVEGGKDAGYGLVIVGGLVLLGAAAYQLYYAGFGAASPQRVFSKTSDLVRRDATVQKVLGPNIKCYGEETSRRRRGLHSLRYFNTNTQRDHLRILFTAEGDSNAADVIAEVTASGQLYLLTLEVPVTGEKLVYTKEGTFEHRRTQRGI